MLHKLLGIAAVSSLLIAAPLTAAHAAPPAPVYSWTGFYLGLNGGYGLAADPFNQTISALGLMASSSIDSRVDPNGGIFGGQFGYNYQFGHAVIGFEEDLQWSGQHDTAGCGFECANEPSVMTTVIEGSAEQNIRWFGTARGRLGWADNGWLVYITGGGALARIDATTAISASVPGLSEAFSNTTGFTKVGWVFGGGTEVRIFGPWSAKLEYLFMDLGPISDTLTISEAGITESFTTNSKVQDNILRAGLNYKFY
jgi:outer membrane immunogenic protein